MSDSSPLFDWAADELERRSQMNRFEARGTLRIALKEAGFAPSNVTIPSLAVVMERVLPSLLARRGVRNSEKFCLALAVTTRRREALDAPEGETPEKVFARFSGGPASVRPLPPASAGKSTLSVRQR